VRAFAAAGLLLALASTTWVLFALFRRSEEKRRCPAHLAGGDPSNYPAEKDGLRLCRKHRAEKLKIETLEKELRLWQ
jgi:hypothetical protein